MDGLAGHIAGEAALRLTGHRLVEGHIQETEVRPLLGVLYQCGRFARACGRHAHKKEISKDTPRIEQENGRLSLRDFHAEAANLRPNRIKRNYCSSV